MTAREPGSRAAASGEAVHGESPTPRPTEPSTLRLWLRPLLFLTVGIVLGGLALYSGRWILGAGFLLLQAFMTYWVSPLRTGPHAPWREALSRRSPTHAVVIWSPANKESSRFQIAVPAGSSRVTYVNYLHDAEAKAFTQAHGGFAALPLALVGERIIPRATAGTILDLLDEAEG